MADLLTHVLVAYVLLTVLGWHVDWLTRRWVAVGMIGAILPDLEMVSVVVDDTAVQALLGFPFTWNVLHTVFGLVLLAGAGAVLFSKERQRVFLVVLFGGMSHLVLDGFRMWADGRTDFWLYPLWWRPPTPNVYVTADWRVPAVTVCVAVAIYTIDTHRRTRSNRAGPANDC